MYIVCIKVRFDVNFRHMFVVTSNTVMLLFVNHAHVLTRAENQTNLWLICSYLILQHPWNDFAIQVTYKRQPMVSS